MTDGPAAGRGLHVRPVRAAGDDGPAIVVVHGGMDRATSFGRVDRHLGDLAVVRYDRRGYGRSRDAGTTDLDGHVDDLLAVIDGREVVAFGHSIGAVVALVAAQRRPDLARAVLAFEVPTPWAPWWRRPGATATTDAERVDPGDEAERFMRSMVGDRVWERLPPSTRADRRAEGPALLADRAMVEVADPPYDLAAIVAPVLSAAGSATSGRHRRAAEELANGARTGELAVVDGATHGAHLTHPAAVAELVRRARALAVGPAIDR